MHLYDPKDERDNCGFGLIADMQGRASHELLSTSLEALANLSHRGAIGADGRTGDGCGVLMQLPEPFFRMWAAQAQLHLTPRFAVGMVFLPRDEKEAAHCRDTLAKQLKQELLTVAGWREVPTQPDVLGPIARASLPRIEQVLVNCPAGWGKHDMERRLFMARRRSEKMLADIDGFYVCTLSCLVIVYKALAMPVDLPQFYPDLTDPRLTTAICLFHQRFSTNTSPRWPLAQPFRFLAHNGEINTISSNRAWSRARGPKFITPLLPDLQQAAPFVSEAGSDSMSLDNMLEVCLAGGMDIFRGLRLLLPPAWEKRDDMDADLRAFYEFNAGHMEPWDGPAGVVMTTGRHVACTLDRNGLRPARYIITSNGWLTLSSEVGVWDYSPADVVEKGRVGPGEMLALDTGTGELWRSNAIDLMLKEQHPYRHWLEQHCHVIEADDEDLRITSHRDDPLHFKRLQKLFGVSREERDQVLAVLAEHGQEAVGSMGDDTPLAVLSALPRSIYDYFRQQFAQVTNPPIDPLRESSVMSLTTRLGSEHNVFQEATGEAQRYILQSPVLSHGVLKVLKERVAERTRTVTLPLSADLDESLDDAVARLVKLAENAVQHGGVMLVLSDREISHKTYPVPALLACGAIHQRLVNTGLRCDVNLLVETASARDPHHFAVLIGCGATAVYPWLAYELIADLLADDEDLPKALANYRKGIEKGLLKILSKMGISTIQSYRGGQIFEAIGLHKDVVERCFPNVACRIQGACWPELQEDILRLHQHAWDDRENILHGGLLKYQHDGEYHAWNPDVVQTLQAAVSSGDYDTYKRYAVLVNERPISMIRDHLQLKPGKAIALESTQSEQDILKSFDSAGMSIGALSPEAHETLAIAMNRLGGRSNSGEGGEDPARYGNERVSKIKQIASGRFGVTPTYLMSAEVLQIKIAQGAKPGEGGQLPGHKVSVEIAKLRHATPGVTLISPPPHHDIYSIEDLAQLIHDLKSINPNALVSVKLVAEAGIGTIACGVVKCGADLITISGYDGGTGASPLTSVKYAGGPWELGLVEVQQALVANGLRDRVIVQVDGGFKTGVDVVKAAILGADSFGFGTGPMVAMGCKYLRICHLNNCATGVATQNITLREKHFVGTADKVMHFFKFIARETREQLVALGVASLKELRGRVDLLQLHEGHTSKQRRLDLRPLLATMPVAVRSSQTRKDAPKQADLNEQIVNDVMPHTDKPQVITRAYRIRNRDRSVGAALAGALAQKFGSEAPPVHVQLQFRGVAGQSFGVWNAPGVELTLIGDANDYVGKGMAGGRIIIHPAEHIRFLPERTPILGNTCLYGATGGELYARGRAGERFAVRNSGALAVVEGCGDHGCEYMTGGVVVVLGKTGRNFAAGMSGGIAFVQDDEGNFDQRVNAELVEVVPLAEVHTPEFAQYLKKLIEAHAHYTGSRVAETIVREFSARVRQFKVVKPRQFALHSLLPITQNTISVEGVA